jgi:hypothetical protein
MYVTPNEFLHLLIHYSRLVVNLAPAVSLVALAIAYAATAWGKNGFAVSYAEDVFAGKVWFFGFKAMNLFLFTSLALAWPERR